MSRCVCAVVCFHSSTCMCICVWGFVPMLVCVDVFVHVSYLHNPPPSLATLHKP